MVTPPEIGLLILVIVLLAAAYLLLKAIKPLIINTIVGLVVLWLAGFVGYGVSITPVVLLLVAFGGLPAALLVIVLAQMHVIFTPALLLPAL